MVAVLQYPPVSNAAARELLNCLPTPKAGDIRFVGRDWRQIRVGELVKPNGVRWAELDTTVEEATQLLIESGSLNVILLRKHSDENKAYATFDYSDLNAYLLVVLGLASPNDDQIQLFDDLAKKARERVSIPTRDILKLANKKPMIILPESADLSNAVEFFASGIYRILVCKDGSEEVVGILSQLSLVQFLWENGACFSTIDALYPMTLKELGIGSSPTIAINDEKMLSEALQLMNNEGPKSIAVVDNAYNVVGNISITDVRLLTKSSSLPLFAGTCLHFISVILSERGIGSGKDSFPVFHVYPNSTLAYTVAKLVATRSHRMWVVDLASPSDSLLAVSSPVSAPPIPISLEQSSNVSSCSISAPSPAIPPGSRISGLLTGAVSLSDILILYSHQSSLNPVSSNN